MITIVSKRDGFRRCSVAHSKTITEYEDGHWDEDQLERLKAEPMLVVTVGDGGGEGNEVAIADIVTAIGTMPIDDPELWSVSSGKPHVKVVEEALGEGSNITAAQRDEAWEIVEKNREAGE